MATSTVEKVNGNATDETPKDTTPITERVSNAGGVVKISLGDLRDELGHSRIGRKVLDSMKDYLVENDLGSFPGWVLDSTQNPEPRQWQEVWVYLRDGSAKSAVLDAMSDPDTFDLVSALDMFSNGTPDYKKMSNPNKVALIRAIVCDQ